MATPVELHGGDPINDNIQIARHDDRCYSVEILMDGPDSDRFNREGLTVWFHEGQDSCPNGITNKSLLAILIDRLRKPIDSNGEACRRLLEEVMDHLTS